MRSTVEILRPFCAMVETQGRWLYRHLLTRYSLEKTDLDGCGEFGRGIAEKFILLS